jgi:tripartite-type tricarboxylate transporter receptor subunit TctC
MSKFQTLLSSLITSVAIVFSVQAQQWPSKPIAFVVPFTPGGVTDSTSRVLSKLISARLGQPVTVENRPGAGGSIGIEAASRQAPDGYTIMYGTSGTHAANLALYKNVRYDPITDFVPIHGLSETPLMLVINPTRPYKNVQELIAFAKANPGKLNYGSAGAGTGTHLTAELFQVATGIKMTHVPYKGSMPALTDLMAGNLDLMFDYPQVVMPFTKANKLTALAVTSKSRLLINPELPTVGELGYPDAESTAWGAVFAPAKTPADVVKKIGDAIASAIVDPEMLAITERFGSIPSRDLRDAKLGAFVKSEMVRGREIVRVSGAKLD